MEIDMLSKMRVDELKGFLRLRGLKISGRKEELVARVFVAVENNVQIVRTAEQVETDIAREYARKLVIEGESIPDPFQLQDGWLAEEESVKFWPMTLYPDIFNFLAFHPSELASKDLSDYKTSKAYSYYLQGWLKPLSYNEISSSSKYCLIRTTCKPSQRISDVPHKLWVSLAKANGKIISAHCSCMAGLAQNCNHVAAALFRVEAAIRMGLSNPSCTSKACKWLPNNQMVKPICIKNLKLTRGDFGRRGKKQTELNSTPKKEYNPLKYTEHRFTLNDVASSLRSVCDESDSIIFTAVPKPRIVQQKIPSNVERDFSTFDDFILITSTKEGFLEKLDYFPSHVDAIEVATRGQSENPLWYSMRKHMITASKAHDVKTRMESFCKSGAEKINFSSLFSQVSGQSKVNPELPALRYGRAMEAEAVSSFETMLKETHKNVSAAECGIYLCEDMPFVGGSPDRIITCDCCGTSCLEVKCPYSISHTSPTDPEINLPYLKRKDDLLNLNKNHKYFTQCQVQMAASKIRQSYFFVWTAHGSFVEKISFDQGYWDSLKQLFQEFYSNHYVPSIFPE